MSVLTAKNDSVLAEAIMPREGQDSLVKQYVLVMAGIALLAIAAKIKVPMVPVPMTMGTFAVLTIGAAYGPRLGLVTIIGYMIVGMLGFDIFAGSSSELYGLTYMMGGTGGYLVGYILAILALGWAARQGWDQSILKMGLALLIGNALIYIPGVAWLGVLYGFDKPILAWGLTPFILGDAVKLALAALVIPAVWKLVGKARA